MLQVRDLLYCLSCVLQRIFEIEGRPVPHEIIFVDEAGFNPTKRKRRGKNLIGHWAILNVPSQCRGSDTMFAARPQETSTARAA